MLTLTIGVQQVSEEKMVGREGATWAVGGGGTMLTGYSGSGCGHIATRAEMHIKLMAEAQQERK